LIISGIDPLTCVNGCTIQDYLYPSALARQYAPTDKAWASSTADISASFNSDSPWWFSTEKNKFGEGSGDGGSGGPPLELTGNRKTGKRSKRSDTTSSSSPFQRLFKRTTEQQLYGNVNEDNSTSKIYDFEQVALHEILHGLGFISSWFTWMSNDALLPGFPTSRTETNGSVTRSFSQSYIFDKFLVDARAGIRMKEYASAIRQESIKISRVTRNSKTWESLFRLTAGWALARYMRTTVGVTASSIVFWYPAPTVGNGGYSKMEGVGNSKRPRDMRFAVIHSPSPYSGGSSMNHLDASYYTGTADYLMRPFATSGTGIDAFVPWDEGGPIGPSTLGVLRACGYVTALGPINP
jgi:hypothetical protein